MKAGSSDLAVCRVAAEVGRALHPETHCCDGRATVAAAVPPHLGHAQCITCHVVNSSDHLATAKKSSCHPQLLQQSCRPACCAQVLHVLKETHEEAQGEPQGAGCRRCDSGSTLHMEEPLLSSVAVVTACSSNSFATAATCAPPLCKPHAQDMISKCEDVADKAVATAPQETGSEDQAREAEEKAARQAGRRLAAGPQGQRGESTRRGRLLLQSGRRGDATDHYGDATGPYGDEYAGVYGTQVEVEVEGEGVRQARGRTRRGDRRQRAREGVLEEEEEEDQRLAQERGDAEGDGEYTEDALEAAAVAGSDAHMVPFNVQVQRLDAVLSRWDRSQPEADRWMQGGPQQKQAALQASDPTLPSFSWFSPSPLPSPSPSPLPLGQSEPSQAAKPRWRHPLLGYWFVRRDLSGSRPPKSIVRPEVSRKRASRALAAQQDGPASAPRTCILPISAPRWLALALTCRKPISARVCCKPAACNTRRSPCQGMLLKSLCAVSCLALPSGHGQGQRALRQGPGQHRHRPIKAAACLPLHTAPEVSSAR